MDNLGHSIIIAYDWQIVDVGFKRILDILMEHLSFLDNTPSSNTTLVSSFENKLDATRDKMVLQIRRLDVPGTPNQHRVVRNGIQVMPKEFIDDPQGSADRLEKPENVDKILPDGIDFTIHEYYAPTTRVIFILGT